MIDIFVIELPIRGKLNLTEINDTETPLPQSTRDRLRDIIFLCANHYQLRALLTINGL